MCNVITGFENAFGVFLFNSRTIVIGFILKKIKLNAKDRSNRVRKVWL